jgi:hypothetical protein
LDPNPETLSASASTPIGRFEFFPRFSWSFAGYDGKNFNFQYGEVWRFRYGTNEPKAFTSFLFPMRHGSIVEFLFDDSRTSAAEPTIVHLNQMLHTSSGGTLPALALWSVRQTQILCLADRHHHPAADAELWRRPLNQDVRDLSPLRLNAKGRRW